MAYLEFHKGGLQPTPLPSSPPSPHTHLPSRPFPSPSRRVAAPSETWVRGFSPGKFFKSAIAVGEFWCISGGLVTSNCIVSGAESFKIGMFHEGHVVEINVCVIKTGLIMLVCYQGCK